MAKKKKGNRAFKLSLLILTTLLSGLVFSSVALVLLFGMMPTLVAAVVDQSKTYLKTMTVGFMNFAGCAPFLVMVWQQGSTMDAAIDILKDPQTIVVMYFAAAMGYMIDWAMTGIVSSIMVQRGRARLKDIEKHQNVLKERWGVEVSGTVPLDEYGFAKETYVSKVAPDMSEKPSH
jgi:hypothetical protein